MRSSRLQLISWALYDWANSAFAAVVQTFLFASYFTRAVAEDETSATSQWGMAIGIAGVIVAITGPFLGAIADETGRRKPWIGLCTGIGIAATALMWFVRPSQDYVTLALLLAAVGTVGTEIGVIFYNAMLPDMTTSDRIGRWSGWGWGLGYAGGLASLLVCLFLFVQQNRFGLDESSAQHIRASLVFTAAWFLLFSLPLFAFVREDASRKVSLVEGFRRGWRQLAESIRQARRYAPIIRFLIARMIYIDGLATIFALGGVFAAGAFDMAEEEVLKFGIGLNITAGIGAAFFGWIDDRIGSKKTISVALVGLTITTASMLATHDRQLFWVIGMILGLFVGPVQTASRSYMAHAAPEELRNQMFGLFALSGKATAFLGPFVVGALTALTGSQRIGMTSIVVLLLLGLVLLQRVPDYRSK